MRDRFPGHYRPTPQEFEELWGNALIVPDTNVLLNLYRLNEGARTKLLEILGAMQERLFVPYQVVAEYQRNRLSVIEQQTDTYKKVEKAVKGFAASVGGNLRQHPRLDRKDLEKRLDESIAPVLDYLKDLREDHPDPLTSDDPIGADVVRDALEQLLSGRIGPARDLDALIADGRKRYERKQPPGWRDEEKPEPERYGDLAIWLDMIAKAETEELPVIFVTEERKPDWWKVLDGRALSPQPDLVEEMKEKTGQFFWLYGIEQFMEKAAEELKIEFSEDEREDVARVETAASAPVPQDIQWYGGGSIQPLATSQWHSQTLRGALPNRAFDRGARGYQMYGGESVFPVAGPSSYSYLGNGWKTSQDISETGAILRIAFEPQMVGSYWSEITLICLVIDPEGNRSLASQKTNTASTTFNFPEDFGTETAPPAGSYTYTWHQASAVPGQSSTEIGRGEFVLPSKPDAAQAST